MHLSYLKNFMFPQNTEIHKPVLSNSLQILIKGVLLAKVHFES